MYNSHLLLSFVLLLFVAFSASGAVAPAHHNDRRQIHLAARQTSGQEETRTRGGEMPKFVRRTTIESVTPSLNITDVAVSPVARADINPQCPFDGASCVLIEPKGDSSRKPEVRCGYLGSTRS
ncbi:hypothetical protein BDP55DRAFT_627021 [Colletotrichum godetiae]|uniref:Uncharacterized protein n=1 Tax=Colletotrichum godetiae TaxID=1209918 RepID=A0AAJ0F146_9PEZI|nr:uncharacterized protein BDP55DRAFT_627021 [Colletotrichum godetiae]KAK1691346.1 hypothetical protein BDP55DRAFT_627021 [Colletotrichum godetiae]